MSTATRDVAPAFMHLEQSDIVACAPKEARGADQAVRKAGVLAATEARCGRLRSQRTGDPALGDFEGAVIRETMAEVDGARAKLID